MDLNTQKILNNISEAFFILDDKFSFTFLNQQAEKLLGRGKNTLLGCNIWNEFPYFVNSSFYNTYHRVLKEKISLNIKEYVMPFNQWFHIRINPYLDGAMVFFTDITEDHQNQLVFHESTENFRAIFENSALGIGLVDLSARPVKCNSALLNMLGYTMDELSQMKFTDFTHPEDAGIDISLFEEMIDKKRNTYQIDKRYICKDGSIIWARLSVSPIYDSQGNLQHIMSTMEDITEIKMLEKKEKELAKEWERLSLLDGLTELNNRRAFDKIFKEEWTKCLHLNKPLSLILIDIDNFKAFNDTYGHLDGDDCLKIISKEIKRFCSEIGLDSFRFGGEEFAIIIPEKPEFLVKKIGEDLRKAVENLHIEHAHSTTGKYLTISLGVASQIPDINSFTDMLLRLADIALYQAKQKGKNQVSINSQFTA